MTQALPIAQRVDEGGDVAAEHGVNLPAADQHLAPGLTRARLSFLENLVFNGMSRDQAAREANLTPRAGRYIMRDPRCLRVYQAMLAALRASERPKSILKLAELRDQGRSLKVSLDAAKTLAAEPSGAGAINFAIGVNIRAGYVVDVSRHAAAAHRLLASTGSGSIAGVR